MKSYNILILLLISVFCFSSCSNYTPDIQNINDVLEMNQIEIENEIIRTNYRYNIEKFLSDVKIF